jgi:rhodanese-related sulfurtransferase
MRLIPVLFCLFVVFGPMTSLAQVKSKSYRLMLQSLLSRSVPEMSVAQLAENSQGYTLLDAREPSETNISGIAGALPVGYDHFQVQSVAYLDKNIPVVVYCSVGYRSEKIAEKLLAAGFTQVFNLYGGIFEWVNQGQPVVDKSGKTTRKVHAYSRAWGVWLRKGERVY